MSYGVNAPLGAVAASFAGGSTYINNTQAYQIAPAYGTSLFQGDLVSLHNGTITQFVPSASNAGVPTAASTLGVGVFQGCKYFTNDPTNPVQFSTYWPASTVIKTGTSITAYVYTDPNNIFDIQMNGTLAYSSIGQNATVNFATNGNTFTGTSGMVIDTVTVNYTPALVPFFPFTIIGFTPVPGNFPTSVTGTSIPYANLLVKLNSSNYIAGQTQIA